MLDVVSMRLQEVYAKWEAKTEITRNEGSNSNRFSLDGNDEFLSLQFKLYLRKNTTY